VSFARTFGRVAVNSKIRRLFIGVFLTAFFGPLGFLLLARRPAIAPIERPVEQSFSTDSVARGEVLAAEGHCAACHTEPGGQPFAGGYGLHTPFGIIYGDNITPDPKTGIGDWSLEAFTRAMREGVTRDGSHLFPAFPYYAFTKLTDDDIKALYAYLMTRPAISSTPPRNTVPFPLNIRAFQEGWKILFFREARFHSDPSRSAEWNRGAYLAEALSDCSGCHTPRNALGGEKIGHVRERRDDIGRLVRYFVRKYAQRMGKRITSVPRATMEALTRHTWPGNIRELQNLMERAVLLSKGPSLRVPLTDIVAPCGLSAPPDNNVLEQVERELILRALRESNWVVGGTRGAAARLRLNRTGLAYKIKKFGISRSS
jgi:mono/diheme cytochrome c family protein